MDDARIEFQTAIDAARTAYAAWVEHPTRENFLTYRDASEVAVKWHRARRLGGPETAPDDDGMDALLEEERRVRWGSEPRYPFSLDSAGDDPPQ
jgi:hypothetical protein